MVVELAAGVARRPSTGAAPATSRGAYDDVRWRGGGSSTTATWSIRKPPLKRSEFARTEPSVRSAGWWRVPVTLQGHRGDTEHEIRTDRTAFTLVNVEPMTGIEPAYSAWEADVLPLNYIGVVASEG